MPLVESPYNTSGLFKNSHFATIYSAKIRPKIRMSFQRERLDLPDGDFIDLDWLASYQPSRKLAILLHGLEGNSRRIYMKGQARPLVENGWNVASVNYRGCSGEPNLLFETYNAGKTKDLELIINHILEKDLYDEIALIGFSLGGNLLLKYLGERENTPKQVTTGIAISSPLSLEGSLNSLTRGENWVYRTSFLYHLRKKYKIKTQQFPENATVEELKMIKSLLDFDNIYTAPAHGFEDAYDYYTKNSSLQYLDRISQKVLILNALNDTFLSEKCFPFDVAKDSGNIFLETPKYGGHVGFYETNKVYYSEKRTVKFLNE